MSQGTGVKHDQGKPPMSLLPREGLVQIAKVLEYGAKKYSAQNWRGGMKWSRLLDAAIRHTYSFVDGEDVDPETGIPHVAHAACNLLFLLEFMKTHQELDDRYKGESK